MYRSSGWKPRQVLSVGWSLPVKIDCVPNPLPGSATSGFLSGAGQTAVSIDLVEVERWYVPALVDLATPESLFEQRWAFLDIAAVRSTFAACEARQLPASSEHPTAWVTHPAPLPTGKATASKFASADRASWYRSLATAISGSPRA